LPGYFSLAEILLGLTIIGIIALETIPGFISGIQDQQYKTAYKQALSDFSNVVAKLSKNDELTFPSASGCTPTNNCSCYINAVKISKEFQTIKLCNHTNLYECWDIDGERGSKGYPHTDEGSPFGFIDSSGRHWVLRNISPPLYCNTFFVDTNGFARPNMFGKDRFVFQYYDIDNNIFLVYGSQFKDYPSETDCISKNGYYGCTCGKAENCLYESWLTK